ncbi:cation:proton antiporter [Caldivirga maquilingensis]|uniref:Sodium/hydrogen exchanger n=1 Tax=Caldivirga maquilingensis (strain ATCC 700844 / DSM 13496 / JCM 10307 / IC-167) TaxID=397948 RepID=A8M9H9_CALMQ|nr:cation:proton antiporter [Caldivirga maquilingensis]ABW00860.1 sodium/hydrogen exchanger [Caldivirga maquilingensis IC-167]
MNELIASLLYVGLMLILAKLLEEAFLKIKLVPFVGAIIVGVMLGDGVLGLVNVNMVIQFISSLGIILLLFLSGAEEFEFRSKLSLSITAAAAIELALPFLLTYVSVALMNLRLEPLLIIPLIMTSVGPLARLLMDMGITRTSLGNSLFQQGVLVEIASVVLFAVLLTLQLGGSLVTLLSIILLIALVFIMGPWVSKLLERVEGYIKVREIEFAAVISLILIMAFLAELVNFNSAIMALFLGILLKRYLNDRPELLEKLHGFTYGFFEPLFFVSIGLYFTKVNLGILALGFSLALILLASKILAGALSAMVLKVKPLINGLGTSTKGGVDASLLVTLLTMGLIPKVTYSYLALAIIVNSLAAPLFFRLITRPVIQVNNNIRVKLNSRIMSISDQVKPLTASCGESLKVIINRINERGVRAIAIVDNDNKPLGYLSVQQLLDVDPALYETTLACDLPLNELVTIDSNAKVIDVLRRFRETEAPLIAVVDDSNRLIATIYERELLRLLTVV